MDIRKALEQLDLLFDSRRIDEVEGFLLSEIKSAEQEDDDTSIISLVNELIGFYRTAGRHKDAMVYCDYIVSLMRELNLEKTVPYATTLLNVATAYRAAGKAEDALEYYGDVLKIYEDSIPDSDMRLASLYNNMSLAYNEIKDYEKACLFLEKALSITVKNEDTEIEEATTHSNLATTLMRMNKLPEAVKHIEAALEIYESSDGPRDFHYSSALSAMGEVLFRLKDSEGALKYYKQALNEIESSMGKNSSYVSTCSNISFIYNRLGNKEEAEKYKNMAEEVHSTLNR
ncbi:tetratricopeptide repeat protein [Sedimentibacter sp.]|uniref:tetratricopeptide repeat protein n=1 Tax=Sedimentibacter sp. TaxID=1960295 RepID=UPI0028A1907F|nr:tetratricopeptide repeat protein [Sedimentibacter sp.]